MPEFLRMLRRASRPRPALERLLSALRARGCKLAVLSDYGWVPERLEALGIPLRLFDALLTSGDGGALKPAAAPFVHAARVLGLGPFEVLVVGDREDLDETGARAAGMRFLGVRSRSSDRPYGSWEAVRRELERATG